jgi:hypothetical protein
MNEARLQELAQNLGMLDQLSVDECRKIFLEDCFTKGWTPELLERLLTRLFSELNSEQAGQLLVQMKDVIAPPSRTYDEDSCLFPPLVRLEVKKASLRALQKAIAILQAK